MDDEIATMYRQMHGTYGAEVRSLGWSSTDRQQIRFAALLNTARLTNVQSVLDVGSGMGDLIPHLEWAKPVKRLDYTGVEMMPEFVKIAQERHPGYKFIEGDVREMLLPQYDFVVSSGLLGWYTLPEAFKMLENLWAHTKRVMAFNFSTVTSELRDRNVLDFAGRAPAGYTLKNDYLEGDDFTVHMYRVGPWE
jgi:trans-aconitate methyltransferase